MTRKYHGRNNLASIKPANSQELLLIIQTQPADLNFVLKILETHSHLVLPVQLDPAQGLLGLHIPSDQKDSVLQILVHLPRPIRIIE